MKLTITKSREVDSSILEREVELTLEDYRKGWDHEVELCETRTEYFVKGLYYGFRKNLTNPLKFTLTSLDVLSGLVLSFIPGGFSRMMKDSKTGKYVLRYTD